MSGLHVDALRAEKINGGVTYEAGPRDAVWERAEVALVDQDLPSDGSGRFAIVVSPVPAESWRVDALLRRVRDRGYVGIAAPGAARLDAGSRRLAERIGLLVLGVERPFELAEVTWRIAEARDALALDLIRRLATAFRYPASDLRDLLGHIASSAGYGVALLDADGVYEQAGGDLGSAAAMIDWSVGIDILEHEGMSVASTRVDRASRPGLRLAFFASGVGQAQRMALAVAAQVTMPAVAARILIDEIAAVSDASASSELLRDFLDAGEQDPDIGRRMTERGWRTTGFHLGFRMVGRTRLDPRELLRAVTAGLGEIEVEAHATTMGRGVVGWMRFVERPDPAELDRQVRRLRELHLQVRRTFNIATGVGTLQAGAAGLSATIDDAVGAARIAAERSLSDWFVRIDAFGLEQLLLARTESDTFVPAAEALLAPLRAEGGGLIETLAVYLDNESGIAATAQQLGIHRNTVAQRVRRIEELLGVDLRDASARLALHLASRAMLR